GADVSRREACRNGWCSRTVRRERASRARLALRPAGGTPRPLTSTEPAKHRDRPFEARSGEAWPRRGGTPSPTPSGSEVRAPPPPCGAGRPWTLAPRVPPARRSHAARTELCSALLPEAASVPYPPPEVRALGPRALPRPVRYPI